METTTIHVVLDRSLLRATDRAARKGRANRSAFIRDALRLHLERLRISELERLEREGYERVPDSGADLRQWESVASLPGR